MNDDVALPPQPLANRVMGIDEIDTRRMVVRGVICTADEDAQGDVVEPGGGILDYHRLNPAVLFHHGIGIGGPDSPGYILPIAKAEDPDGNYTVRLVNNELIADTYFSQTSPFAAQAFALCQEKILRGFSVNALPLEWSRRPDMEGPRGRQRAHTYSRWILKEYSLTALPVNHQALTLAVEKGMVGGVRLGPLLRQSLRPYCIPKNTAWSRGTTMDKAKNYEHEGRLVGETVGGVAGGAAGELIGPEGIPVGAAAGGYAGREVGGFVGSKIRKADEMDGMTEAHEHIRNARMHNAHHHILSDDEATAEAHRELDEHLAKAEEIAADTMEANGHERPDGADFEQLKSLCKAGLRTAVGAGAGALVGNSLGGPVGAVAGGATGAYLANDDDDKQHKAMTATEKRIVERRLARIERLNQPR